MGRVTKNPPEEAVSATEFTFELYGEGWSKGADVHSTVPDKRVKVKVSDKKLLTETLFNN